MRSRDWSSYVGSSDLGRQGSKHSLHLLGGRLAAMGVIIGRRSLPDDPLDHPPRRGRQAEAIGIGDLTDLRTKAHIARRLGPADPLEKSMLLETSTRVDDRCPRAPQQIGRAHV